jgi:fucose permease
MIFESALPVAYAILLFCKSPWLIALAFLLSGVARGACSNFSNAMVNQLAPGKAAVLNGLHAMFSIGAFIFPIILMMMTANNSGNWMIACGMMLVLGCMAWILYSMFPVIETAGTAKESKKVDYGFFKEPIFYLCTGTLFFYLCAEQGVIGWLITYFKDSGIMSASLSQVMASVLWVMILAGRLTAAALSTKVKKENLLLYMGIGFVLFFIVLLFSRNTAVIVLGILGFGYSMAGIYPTTVSFAGKLISKYSMAWSFILTFASMGSILMPTIIGRIAETAGIVSGMSSVVTVVAIDLVMICLLRRYIKKHQ